MGPESGDVPTKLEKKIELDGLIEKKKSEYLCLLQNAQKSQETEPGSSENLGKQVNDYGRYELALAYNERGQMHYRMIEFDKAVEDYTEAVHYCDKLAAAYFNRGTIRYRMGCFDVALPDMEKAVSLEPDNKEFQLGLQETKSQL